MGVPKFYRWISERYSQINQVITDSALLPEFDHLYLDMNGIIHGCTHPSHLDVSERLSERDMMMGIMHYIDRIVTQIVRPKVSVYMAIDGVAPRAKLNQQRSRRFRSAKDLAEATKAAKQGSRDNHSLLHDPTAAAAAAARDDALGSNPADAFDSNCITPGTAFMARVSEVIKYFIRKKIKEDPLWRNLRVIFSGHEIPGEGEHKIMQHIRDMRNHPNYQPNTRHCMYGQDADLIMLGLVSHEPHFTLLREIVQFGMPDRNKNTLKTVKRFTKKSDFQLLHLSLLREYLHIEFHGSLTNTDPQSFDLERIIDDFVFMTFLVGNDFLPHLPAIDVSDGAFDLLFSTYKEQRPTWGPGQYLTDSGDIANANRLEQFFRVIGAAETDILEQREENEAKYLKKKLKWDKRDGITSNTPTEAQMQKAENDKQTDYLTMLETLQRTQSETGSSYVDGWHPPAEGQKDYKGRYYYEKLHMTPLDVAPHMALRKAYLEGLMWCLAYYYKGCISWGWFFPYHYGPMLSDLTNLDAVMKEIHFELGSPLKPFQQLMGCLPPASAALVPKPYQKLMCSPDSPIRDFYPTDFVIDMNGKRNPWEGVNLLPFIDVQLLITSIEKHCPDRVLTADERARNSSGKVFLYTFDMTANDTVPSFNREIGFPDIPQCHSRLNVLDSLEDTKTTFCPELIKGTQIPFPGFPSLSVLPIASVELKPIGLNCFGTPSRYPNTVLTLHQMPQLPCAADISKQILGKSVYINWPMMHEAKVVAVTDNASEVRVGKKKNIVKTFSEKETEDWDALSMLIQQQYLNGDGSPGSGGVEIGTVQLRLSVKPLQGMKTSPTDGSTKKVFGKEEAEVPIQMALWNAPAPDPRFVERGPRTLKDIFPVGYNVILTKGKYKGCIGSVHGIAEHSKEKRVITRVQVVPPEPPFGLAIARSIQESYISSADAAKVLKLHPIVFARITGSVSVDPGRYDLGLNLRYKEDLYVLGYSRKREIIKSQGGKKQKEKKNVWKVGDSLRVVGSRKSVAPLDAVKGTNGSGESDLSVWEYTPKAIRLVAAYRQKFPQVFAALSKKPRERFYSAQFLFGPKGEETLPRVREWLNNAETAKIPRTPTSTMAMPLTAISAVQRAAEVRSCSLEKSGPLKEVTIRVPPSALYREGSTTATDVITVTAETEPLLGDRVVNLCADGIPFGARGTVVSIHHSSHGCVEVVMDEEFIGGSNLQGSCANFRGKLCLWSNLLRISATDSTAVVDKLVGPAKEKVQQKTLPKQEATTTNVPLKSGGQLTVKDDSNEEARRAGAASSSAAIDRREDQVQSARTGERQRQDSTRGENPPTASNSNPSVAKKETGVARNRPDGRTLSRSPPVTERSRISTPSEHHGGKSPGRRKQGAWREAAGPRGKGIGFGEKSRRGTSGYERWERHIFEKIPDSSIGSNSCSTVYDATSTNAASQDASATLKAMLDIETSQPSQANELVSEGKAIPSERSENDASAMLKASLGVAGMSGNTAIPPPVANTGVTNSGTNTPQTAADALMQLMIQDVNSHPVTQPSQMLHTPREPDFNFTYVEEGREDGSDGASKMPDTGSSEQTHHVQAPQHQQFHPAGTRSHLMLPPHMVPPHMLPPHMMNPNMMQHTVPPHMIPPHMMPPHMANQHMMNTPMMMGAPPPQPPPPSFQGGMPGASIPREKKRRQKKEDKDKTSRSTASIVPSAVLTSKRKEG